MIAVTVVAVISAIAVPWYSKVRQDARAKQAQVDLQILSNAIRQLAWDTGQWPGGEARDSYGNLEFSDLSAAACGLLNADNRFSGWDGPYIPKVPEDPWGSGYFFDADYRVGDQWRVVVGSYGPNRVGPNRYDSDDIYIILL
jgi:type II secretory pathway pseudopilin PulG